MIRMRLVFEINMRNSCIYGLLVFVLIFACNSPKRQKKINDNKLYNKLQEKAGYLNASELKRLDYNFSLKVLDSYDFSGFDDADTLAYFVRSGKYLWMASCYISDEDNPFFCLKEEKERQFKVIRKGMIPQLYGECFYDLEKLVIPVGNYVFVSQRSSGNGYCDENPLVFTLDGEPVKKQDDKLQVIIRNCPDQEPDNLYCFERTFGYGFKNPLLTIRITEKKINWETSEIEANSDYILRYSLEKNTIRFLDTIYR